MKYNDITQIYNIHMKKQHLNLSPGLALTLLLLSNTFKPIHFTLDWSLLKRWSLLESDEPPNHQAANPWRMSIRCFSWEYWPFSMTCLCNWMTCLSIHTRIAFLLVFFLLGECMCECKDSLQSDTVHCRYTRNTCTNFHNKRIMFLSFLLVTNVIGNALHREVVELLDCLVWHSSCEAECDKVDIPTKNRQAVECSQKRSSRQW